MRELIKKCVGKFGPTHIDVMIKVIDNLLEVKEHLVILDIGGGSGEYWTENTYLNKLIRENRLQVRILDAQIPSENRNSILIFQKGYVPDDLASIESKTFDIVLAFDLIEHLTRDRGYLMLYQMERISRYFCMIFTPNGFVYQSPDALNVFNAHISGWTPKDLRQFGYTIFRGHSGFKFLFGVYGLPKWKFDSKILHNLLVLTTLFSQILVSRLPSKSFAFIGIKKAELTEKELKLSRINRDNTKG